MSEPKTPAILYDCDTSDYWCSDEAYQDKTRVFGRFIENGNAYEILDRHTPRPWLNYFCNDKFGSVVSNDGLGFTFYKTTLLRVTKYEHPVDYLPREFKDGRKLFIKDATQGKTWDVFAEAQDLKCVHRPGMSTLTAQLNGLDIEMKVFVAAKDSAECWMIEIRNQEKIERQLEVSVEQVWTFSKFGIHTAEEGIPYLSTPGKDLAISLETGKVLAHSTNQDLPFPMYGLFTSPQLKKSQCSDDISNRKDGRVFAFKVARLSNGFTLKAGGKQEIDVLSGADQDPKGFETMKSGYASAEAFHAELEKVSLRWKELLQYPSCQIPHPDLQNFLNVWFKNQLFLTFRFVRSGYVGYRDTLQDSWGYTLMEPQEVHQNLLRTLSHMKTDGSCPRNYSMLDNAHDHRLFMDSGVWIPLALVDYVKETGNTAFLEEKIPYLDNKTPGSVSEHAWKALELLYHSRGSHGLCLVGDGDWNDALEGISKGGKAESAWLSIALFHSQNVMAELYEHSGDQEKAKTLKDRSAKLKKTLNEQAWDGNWYVYGFTGTGKPIGSHKNKEGIIHLNSQSWAIFSGLADADQTAKMRAAIEKYLQTDLGPALLGPPYVEEGAEVGRIAKLQPGTFENGSVYQHAVTFHILAEIQSGHPEEAYKNFVNLLPTNPENFDSRRTSEPYCTGNYYCGPGHPRFGQNFFSWFTGNAAWLLRIGFDQLLGVKAEFNGLLIDPKVPAAWNQFFMKRLFRGTHFQFNFERAKDGAKSITVDGVKIQGNLVPVQTKKEVSVKVYY